MKTEIATTKEQSRRLLACGVRADYRTSNGMPTVQEYHRGEMSMIERLFPEIAKEVEE